MISVPLNSFSDPPLLFRLTFFYIGDDLAGRPVIAFSACRLPNRKDIDHQQLLWQDYLHFCGIFFSFS